MICVRCKKRPAVVFVTIDADSSPKGYCIPCSRELGIKPVSDLMEKMGITDQQIDEMYDQMGDFMDENGDFDVSSLGKLYSEMMNGEDASDDDIDEGDDDFAHGAPAFPPFLKNVLGGNSGEKSSNQDKKSTDSKKARNEKKKYKHLNTYCENLTKKAADGKLDMIIGKTVNTDIPKGYIIKSEYLN